MNEEWKDSFFHDKRNKMPPNTNPNHPTEHTRTPIVYEVSCFKNLLSIICSKTLKNIFKFYFKQ